jgi:histidine ammonia-lyase
MATVVVDGSSLDVGAVVAVARAGARVEVARGALARMAETRALVERVVLRGDSVYGLTTGVGVRKRVALAGDEIARFNRRIIAEHRTAQGRHAPDDVVRATMLRLLNGFARGSSGVRPALAERLADALNRGEQPRVRMLGSIGQADLMPLADLAADVFSDVPLEAKEGLAVLNANAFSTGWAALAIADARTLLDTMTLAAALDLEAFGANLTPLHEAVGRARPYPGLVEELRRMRAALAGSRLWEAGAARNLQDPLSFRGAAAILGSARDALGFVERQLAVELNASQENPLALLAEDRIISVANYESLPLAMALDLMRIALVPAVSAANERLIKLLQAPQTGLSDGLHAPGVSAESSLSEYTWPAQALAIEARLLGQPVSLEIPSASQAEGLEDRASMTPLAARRLAELVDLARGVVAIELVVAAQAVELRHGAAPDAIGVGARRVFAAVRELVGFTGPGQTLESDLDPVRDLIARGVLASESPLQEIAISLVEPGDAGELLTLQRAAYVSEGQIYENASIPPLTQTLAELEQELAETIALKATLGTRMVGTARARLEDGTLHIGRIAVAPDMQGRGIGTRLIERLEADHGAGAHTFALFTGDSNPANRRLYERLGYRETHAEVLDFGVRLVHLAKPAADESDAPEITLPSERKP